MERERRLHSRTLSGINFILGTWLIVSPYILGYTSSAAKWDQTIFGIVILILSATRYIAPRMEWASWLNSLAGLWMIIAPFLLNYSTSASYWNEVIVGVVVTIIALWNMNTGTSRYHPSTS